MVPYLPFMPDCFARAVRFGPAGALGLFFFKPGLEFVGGHVDELVELSEVEGGSPVSAWVSWWRPPGNDSLDDGLVVFHHLDRV